MAFWSKKAGGSDATSPSAEPPAATQETAIPASAPPAMAAPAPARDENKPATAGATATPTPELSPEAKKKAADASKNLMAAFGQVTSIMMRAPQYRKHTLADLEWLVVPAVTTGQFAMAEAQSKANGMMVPVGVLLWASVSPEVDKRLVEATESPMRLSQDEWRSGDILWVIDGIGEQQMIQTMLKRKMAKDWAGRQVKMKVRDKTGVMRVGVLSKTALQASGASGTQ